jgi:lysozyme family protein
VNFEDAFDALLGNEGGYSNNRMDPGGETMWGITARVARADGFTGDMHDLPRERAKTIYKAKYWDAINAESLPDSARFTVFDAAVNSGPAQAIGWLQRVLDVGEDGVIGPLTVEAMQRANGLLLAVQFTGERLDFMTTLPTWGAFGKGWARRIANNLKDMA